MRVGVEPPLQVEGRGEDLLDLLGVVDVEGAQPVPVEVGRLAEDQHPERVGGDAELGAQAGLGGRLARRRAAARRAVVVAAGGQAAQDGNEHERRGSASLAGGGHLFAISVAMLSGNRRGIGAEATPPRTRGACSDA